MNPVKGGKSVPPARLQHHFGLAQDLPVSGRFATVTGRLVVQEVIAPVMKPGWVDIIQELARGTLMMGISGSRSCYNSWSGSRDSSEPASYMGL